MVNTRAFEPGTEPYVLSSQCEQVFYSEVPIKAGWSYVVRYDPRGRPVMYNHVDDEDNHEEEYDDDDSDQEQVAKKKTTCNQCTTSEDRNGSFTGNGEEN